VIPGAGQRQLWSVEDAPDLALPFQEQLAGYRRLRAVLQREIRVKLLLATRLAMLPQRK
jgi:hypothetical protein